MKKVFYFLSGLVMEPKSDKMSLGRISWWVTFGIAAKILFTGNDITSNHLTILLILAGYNLGKHSLDMVKNKMAKNDKTTEE